MARIVAFRWTPADGAAERECRARWTAIAGEREWKKFIDRRGVLAFYDCSRSDHRPIVLPLEQGAVFGPAFDSTRPGCRPRSGFEIPEAELLARSGGEHLVRRHWGFTQALLHGRATDRFYAVRDCMGSGQLFVGRLNHAWLMFSHLEDYLALADEAEPDLEFLSAFLAYPRLVCPRTAIRGVVELMAGEEVCFGRTGAPTYKNVWPVGGERMPACDAAFAARAHRLRETLLAVGRSWAHVRPQVAHRLSGGLDSSLALGLLARANASEVIAINEFAPLAPESDERRFARAAAASAGVRLIEVEMAAERVDYQRILALPPGAKPSRAEMSVTDPTLAAVLADVAPDALVTSGQGGDQLFHRARLPIIAADAWRDGCTLGQMTSIIGDVARLARTPIWDVFSAVARHGVLRRQYKPGGVLRGMRAWDMGRGAVLAAEMAKTHPWTGARLSTSPARALRLHHIADLAYYHQPFGLALTHLCAPILASQPVAELCLATPPYMMVWGGVDRALARVACEGLTDVMLRDRLIKGDTTRYHATVAARQMAFMQAIMHDGQLVRHGLVEAPLFETALARSAVTKASEMVGLISALLVELWLRRFEEARVSGLRKRRSANQGLGDSAALCGDAPS